VSGGAVVSGGERPGWRLVEWSRGADGLHFLTVRSGAATSEVCAVVAEMPASILVDVLGMDRSGSGVVMTFREFPDGIVIDSAPGWPFAGGPADGEDLADAATVAPGEASGWVPQIGPAAGPDRGFTPFDYAVSELLRAAGDHAEGAWIMTVVRLVPPAAVLALAEVVRRSAGHCRYGLHPA
jgi:hypothetical protein